MNCEDERVGAKQTNHWHCLVQPWTFLLNISPKHGNVEVPGKCKIKRIIINKTEFDKKNFNVLLEFDNWYSLACPVWSLKIYYPIKQIKALLLVTH